MENKAFYYSHRFGKWMRKYHLKWGMYKVLGVQVHMRQVQRHVFGRSMIEMLGVLAIIGVLSIGGLYTYRQAMIRHKVNQIMEVYDKLHLASYELCWNKETCLLRGNGNAEMLQTNHRYLCALYGNNLCLLRNESSFVMTINGARPYWFFYLNLGDTGRRHAFMAFQSITPEICRALMERTFHKDLYRVYFGKPWNTGIEVPTLQPAEEGRFSQAQQDAVSDACEVLANTAGQRNALLIEWVEK